ncbi:MULTISPECIES: AAA family ATPase [Chlorobiaceae]|uniref:AAA family ATPase n=2 Tax=Chlorobiaceae TaxID=191412 RepID=A0ABW9UQI3_CHLPH|nr:MULTISPECIES: AAA family ATPase [Chlorobiaceae]MWV55325.1 AAA family ATPase [Chlorobium phaeovibrioides]TNJ36175.1 ATP-binding protein [Prosthecochloris vibrioformis]
MSKIRIKNFGPVKDGFCDDDGWIDLRKVTVFIGEQGSGKSTVAKLISTFAWIEKALVRGDYDARWFERKNRFKKFLSYHRLENYLPENQRDIAIEYRGDAYSMRYENECLVINEVSDGSYRLPQIMYVPAERNFISYVKKAIELRLSSESLKEFLVEFEHAKQSIKGFFDLPLADAGIEYDRLNDSLNLKGESYKIHLSEASSGYQSLVPLYLVSRYLSASVQKQSESGQESMSGEELKRFRRGVEDILRNEDLTEEQRRLALSVLSSKFNKTSFVNIVEEPEQNLYPFSQWKLLESLLEFNNRNSANRLILTTHSPYIINYLSIIIQGYELRRKIEGSEKAGILREKLNSVVSKKSLVSPEDVAIYELDAKGSIKRLLDFEGIPSDRNLLNVMLEQGNMIFDALLEIEEELPL